MRLYEEAAWLYMQVGDNMLAIYASEKALRLAESLGEARAASRAHGIFGRVFGRIGDAAKARENLERAVELARESDEDETVLALLALGHNLEHAEGDYDGGRRALPEALALAERIGECPPRSSCISALGPAGLLPLRLGGGPQRRATRAPSWPNARGWSASCACRTSCAGGCAGARATGTPRRGCCPRPATLADRIGWSEVAFSALMALAATLRDRGELERARGALGEALAVCERAGLVPQSVQAYSARTMIAILAERPEEAARGGRGGRGCLQRVHDPRPGRPPLRRRWALVDGDARGARAPAGRAASWQRLGRPLDVARCELLLGRRLREQQNGGAASEALKDAASMYDQLGVVHLAARARELAAS